jgi:hypothetical protein
MAPASGAHEFETAKEAMDPADNRLYPPQAYWRVPNPEDRLFVPAEYVPLFIDRGWKKRRA